MTEVESGTPMQLPAHVACTQARHGFFFVLKNDAYIGRALIEYGEWTESEIDILLQVLRLGDHVLDIGANIGSHTIPIAKRIGAHGLIHCFEPQPAVFQLLAANALMNGLANVRLYHAAVGRSAGTIRMPEIDYNRTANFGGASMAQFISDEAATVPPEQSSPSRDVAVITVDDLQLRELRLMKIDVEGMEGDVLQGAAKTIARCRPVLYVENDRADRSPALLQQLDDLGYDGYWHISACFRADNFRQRTDNIFGPVVCINVLCMPREASRKISGLQKVMHVSDYPRVQPAAPSP